LRISSVRENLLEKKAFSERMVAAGGAQAYLCSCRCYNESRTGAVREAPELERGFLKKKKKEVRNLGSDFVLSSPLVWGSVLLVLSG